MAARIAALRDGMATAGRGPGIPPSSRPVDGGDDVISAYPATTNGDDGAVAVAAYPSEAGGAEDGNGSAEDVEYPTDLV